MDRSGSSHLTDVPCLGDGVGEPVGVQNAEVVFRDRHEEAVGIHLLEGPESQGSRTDLSGQCEHGDGVGVRGGNSRDEVGRSGTACGKTDSGASAGACITVGHVGCALLVTYEDVPDAGVVEFVVDGDDASAGVSEHRVDAFLVEHGYQCFRAFHVNAFVCATALL